MYRCIISSSPPFLQFVVMTYIPILFIDYCLSLNVGIYVVLLFAKHIVRLRGELRIVSSLLREYLHLCPAETEEDLKS